MNRVSILFICIQIFFAAACSAQKKDFNKIHWKIAGQIPPVNGEKRALGLAGPLTGVHQDILVIGGGANFPEAMPWMGGKKIYHNDLYTFKKDGKRGIVSTGKIFQLPFNTAYGSSCSTPKGIVYAGGENEKEISNKVLLIQWKKTTEDIVVQNLPDLPYPVTNASITFDNNIVYIAGGQTTNHVTTSFLSLDLNDPAGRWRPMPPLPKPISHAVMVVESNGNHPCLYLAGGRKLNTNGISDLYSSLYEFDLEKNKWMPKKDLPFPLNVGSGLATGANYILLFGGNKGEPFHQTETVIAAISQEEDEVKRKQLIQKRNQLQSSHPGFSQDVLRYNTITDEWAIIDSIPFDAQVTTTASWWGDVIVIPSGEIKPGVRTPDIIMGSVSK